MTSSGGGGLFDSDSDDGGGLFAAPTKKAPSVQKPAAKANLGSLFGDDSDEEDGPKKGGLFDTPDQPAGKKSAKSSGLFD